MQNTSGTIPYPEGVITLNGNVTGHMKTLAPGGLEQDFTGFVLITKDLNKMKERIEIWDKTNGTILNGKGPLTPIKINKEGFISQKMTTPAVGSFAIADLKDFNCNMANVTDITGNPTTVTMTGPEMKVFGGASDVRNFLQDNESASDCSLTSIVEFSPIPLKM
jgi:hypothetical protein